MKPQKLFHVSETTGIKTFVPRPSPSAFEQINGDVVFAVSDRLSHNYLLPRDCPRVTYYATNKTSQSDKDYFFKKPGTDFVMTIEQSWIPIIQQTILYCYEFPVDSFVLLDECAGYYISYEVVEPVSEKRIENPLEVLLKRNDIELRVLPEIESLADEVVKSSLNFSLIRMRNAKEKTGERTGS